MHGRPRAQNRAAPLRTLSGLAAHPTRFLTQQWWRVVTFRQVEVVSGSQPRPVPPSRRAAAVPGEAEQDDGADKRGEAVLGVDLLGARFEARNELGKRSGWNHEIGHGCGQEEQSEDNGYELHRHPFLAMADDSPVDLRLDAKLAVAHQAMSSCVAAPVDYLL
jgi:hypothetical protein